MLLIRRLFRSAVSLPAGGRVRRAAPALLAAALLVAPPAIAATFDPDNPPQGLFSDEWAEVYMGSAKVGYGHTTMTREGDAVMARDLCRLRLGRAGKPVTMTIEQSSREKLDGGVLGFQSTVDAAILRTATEGQVVTGRLFVTTAQLGMRQTRAYDVPVGGLMSWGLQREGLRRGFATGTTYEVTAYMPDLRVDGTVPVRVRVVCDEPVVCGSRTNVGRRVEMSLKAPAGTMEMVQWVEPGGRPLQARLPLPGLGDLTMLATDQQTALADYVPPEIFAATVIPANRTIARERATRIVYRLAHKPGKAGKQALELPESDAQRVARQPDGSLEVTVVRLPLAPPPAPVPVAAAAASDDEYLGSNLMMNLQDPDLVALAQRAGGSEKDLYRLAGRLRAFVESYVKRKDMDVGFATASEVCRTRKGDCSEHAVLLAALGRLRGLPSRVAAGLAYAPVFGGREDLFGHHLWTQFRIDGRWLDVDAALGEAVCSPTRIAFAVSSLRNAGAVDISLPLLDKVGSLDLRVVSVEE